MEFGQNPKAFVNKLVPVGFVCRELFQPIALVFGNGLEVPVLLEAKAMTSAAMNELMTRVGPGTGAGAVLRRFWHPVAICEELEENRPVRPVTVFGERLVLFRDVEGRLGLIGRHCPHRGADLCYGRLEDGGLRCPFHGWLFDLMGQCLETPAEPENSSLRHRVHHSHYPVIEKNGMIFAYLGEGDPPPFPNLDCLAAPETHSFAFKGFVDCNWLQLLEVGIDPAHASYLHRFLEDEEEEAYGLQFRDAVDAIPTTKLMRDYPRPTIKVERTDFGSAVTTIRNLDNGGMHVRMTNQIFPTAIIIPFSKEMTVTQWHVPVDDVTSYWYAMFTSFGAPVDRAVMRAQRLELYALPHYIPRVGKANDYGFDPVEQRARTYTGMGDDINVHDQWAVESQGAIQDRTTETLGTSDIVISEYRKRLVGEIRDWQRGQPRAVPKAHPRPICIDAIAPLDQWQSVCQERDRERRARSDWACETAN